MTGSESPVEARPTGGSADRSAADAPTTDALVADAPSPRVGSIVVALASLAASAVYAVLGVGFVLDDWYAIGNARFDGAWMAAGPDRIPARPGGAVVYAFVFGPLGDHPSAVLGLQALVGALTAVCLLALLRRFLPGELAFAATLLWVVFPNHTSTEVWAAASNIALAVLLAVVGALLLTSEARWRLPAALLAFGAAALCYEAVIPVSGALIVVLPWVRRGRPDWRSIGGGVLVLGGVALWIVTHWEPVKDVVGVVDLWPVVPGHLGWGIAPDAVAPILLLAAGIGIVVALARLARPATRGPAEWSVLAGIGIVVLGVAPFVKYFYEPLGAGDRANFVSSLGGALIWGGLLHLVWQARRAWAVGGIAVLLGLAVVVRLERSQDWSDAGHDARAIQAGVVAEIPDPTGIVVVVGPAPLISGNVAAFADQSNLRGALRVAYDRDEVRVLLTASQEQFDEYPEDERFDLRTVSRLGTR